MQAAVQRSGAVGTRCSTFAAPRPACARPSPAHPHAASTSAASAVSRRSVVARVAQELMDENTMVVGMDEATQAELLKLPKGYHWYETMLLITPLVNDEDRDRELAKFEAFLNKEECLNINAFVRERTKLAYAMRGHQEGIYAVYTYAAKRQTARTIQLMLSNPEVGSENVLLRHMTQCKY